MNASLIASLFLLVGLEAFASTDGGECQSWVSSRRLEVRLLTLEDQDALLQLFTINEGQPGVVTSEENIQAHLLGIANQGQLISMDRKFKQKLWIYGIFHEAQLIGVVSARVLNSEPAFVGYAMHPDHRGRGNGTEGVFRALQSLLLNNSDIHLVIAHVADDNLASQKLLKRIGFSASYFRPYPGHTKFSITRKRFLERAPGLQSRP